MGSAWGDGGGYVQRRGMGARVWREEGPRDSGAPTSYSFLIQVVSHHVRPGSTARPGSTGAYTAMLLTVVDLPVSRGRESTAESVCITFFYLLAREPMLG